LIKVIIWIGVKIIGWIIKKIINLERKKNDV